MIGAIKQWSLFPRSFMFLSFFQQSGTVVNQLNKILQNLKGLPSEIEVLHHHVTAAILDGITIEYVSLE